MVKGMKDKLEIYLRSALPRRADLNIRSYHHICEGNSNYMASFTLQWSEKDLLTEQRYILRMPAEINIMAPYDPAREYFLLRALKETPVPAPEVLLLEEDKCILGKPFLIMEEVKGDTLSFAYHFLPPKRKRRISNAYAAALATIHSTDWRRLGLFSEEVPVNPAEFAMMEVEKCRKRLRKITGIPRKMLEDALGRLSEKIPQQGELTLVHGDYNIGNALFREDEIRVILDWETACVGDPAFDLGWLYPGDALALGLPMAKEDFITIYRNAGGKKVDNLRFYQDLAMVNLTTACINASLSLDQNRPGGLNLAQMGFTIPYILNSLCYLVTNGLKALQPHGKNLWNR